MMSLTILKESAGLYGEHRLKRSLIETNTGAKKSHVGAEKETDIHIE